MRNQTAPTAKQEGIFFYLLLLTGFFLLLEISFFIQCNKAYLSDFTLVSDKLKIPASILPGIFNFLFAQLFVHVSYCVLVWGVTLFISNVISLSSSNKLILGFMVWTIGIVTALVANQYFFPNSKFSELTAIILFNRTIVAVVFYILLACCSMLVLVALGGLIKWSPRFFVSGLILVFLSVYFIFKPSAVQDAATQEQPNIIIVGVDSLRPDFLSYFGHDKETPFFDAFLQHAAVFGEAVTPLARTFPAWTSILMGQYPRQIGIRSDLAKQININFDDSLARILQRHGYTTLFATDETRFSNIDKNYGFDRVVTPPMGLNDFLLGTFNDFPLSNLLVNTFIGKWLFPHSYANRPVHFTYDPDSFLKLIRPALMEQRSKPLFLAIHFCLPHTPYLWGGLYANNLNAAERYEATVVRVDKQLRDFFDLLTQAQLLKHAIVVMLSDHGEALELPGDRITEKELFNNKKTPVPKFYPPMLDNESIDQSAGHGTDVLGLTQYHALLAFKLYGMGQQEAGVIPGVVSLVDIKPTILTLINKKQNSVSSHLTRSLASLIRGQHKILTQSRHIFLESDFSPEAIRTVYPETRKVILEGIELFQIDPETTRLTVKDSMSRMIINSKQYADIYNEWMLALYPQNKNVRIPILINLNTGVWTDNLQSAFARHSPANQMIKALKAFYGDEIGVLSSSKYNLTH